MGKRHGVSVPSASDRFDFFEIRYGIGMSAEGNVLPLHVLRLAGKVQTEAYRKKAGASAGLSGCPERF